MSETAEGAEGATETPVEEAPVAAVAVEETHGHGEEIHMPPNSIWPLVTSLGVAFTLLGMLAIKGTFAFVLPLGAIILVAGVVMWVVDARKEHEQLH